MVVDVGVLDAHAGASKSNRISKTEEEEKNLKSVKVVEKTKTMCRYLNCHVIQTTGCSGTIFE